MEKEDMSHKILFGTVFFWLAFTLLLFILSGCKHEPINPCSFDTVKYRTDIKPIIERNCTTSGCHNNSNGLGNFNIYDELNEKCNDGSFYKRVFYKKDMPPFKMDTCDFIKLKMWYLDGHKSN